MCMCLENFLSFYLYVCTYIWRRRRRRRKRRENIRERRRRRTGGGADAGGSAQGLSLPNQLGCFETTRTIKHRTLGWRKRKKKKLVRRTWWKRVGRRRRTTGHRPLDFPRPLRITECIPPQRPGRQRQQQQQHEERMEQHVLGDGHPRHSHRRFLPPPIFVSSARKDR